MQPYTSEGYLFPSEKNLWRTVLEAKKKGIILNVMLIVKNIFRVSLLHEIERKGLCFTSVVGKVWRCSYWEKGNFVMISDFKYGQTWKIWPSPLSLSLYSTFKLK